MALKHPKGVLKIESKRAPRWDGILEGSSTRGYGGQRIEPTCRSASPAGGCWWVCTREAPVGLFSGASHGSLHPRGPWRQRQGRAG